MRSATAVLPVPAGPVMKSERRELTTQPIVCMSDSGRTRSRKAARTVSTEAARAGTACKRIMCA